MPDFEWELDEANLELERHHRDFARISELTNMALDRPYLTKRELREFLKRIRAIVG